MEGGDQSNVDWSGLLKWSAQVAGERTNANAPRDPPRQISADDQRFFEAAVSEGVVSEVQRMHAIVKAFSSSSPTAPPDDAVDLLEELRDIVDQIDNATYLHTMGAIPSLLPYLGQSTPPPVISRVAEVLATSIHNNPAAQQSALTSNVLGPLLSVLRRSPHPSCSLKTLLALSAMVRNYPDGRAALREATGNYADLARATRTAADAPPGAQEPRVAQKMARLVEGLVNDGGDSEAKELRETGVVEELKVWAGDGEDAAVREAVLAAAVAVGAAAGFSEDKRAGWEGIVNRRTRALDGLAEEDASAAEDEVRLVGELRELLARL